MERHRQSATARAAEARQERNMALREILRTWPETLDPAELRVNAEAIIPRGYVYRSFLNRVTRLGFLRFDHVTGLWANLCKLNRDD